jgi:hypothetical protein
MLLRLFLIAAAFAGAAVLTPLLTSADAQPATFEAGEAAYIAQDFPEARAIYAAAAASSSQPPKDRAAAYRQLAVMAWRLDDDSASTERNFANALTVGADLSATHAARARFYTHKHRFADAIAAADAAAAVAATPQERIAATKSFTDAVLTRLETTSISSQQPVDRAALARARDLLAPLAAEPPLPLPLSEALLEIALRLDDGPLALVAWRSYVREGEFAGKWRGAARTLIDVLPGVRNAPPTARQREAIFAGLAASQFFAVATLIATDERVPDAASFRTRPEVADVLAYAAALRGFRDVTDAYYRDHALKRASAGAWQKALFAEGEALWRNLSGAKPAYSLEALDRELRSRFGAYINLGKTGGVLDLHYGHIFLDDRRPIDQYGRRAVLHLIALDRIVSNGYESWVWDGRQAHGGWASGGSVIQIRPGYVDSAFRDWAQITDPKQRAEEEGRIASLSQRDDGIARNDAAAYLPGLAARLDWQGRNAIADRLRAQGVAGPDMKRRFIIDYNRIGLDANFFAHEGRHVLDQQALGDKVSSEELEFRAKLSEIAFSEQPRLSYGPIFNANIADAKSPHGRANKRIMQGLVAWMDAHRSAVTGLDLARPLLPQFDKLTDEQMRAAMRAMDPWAPKS